MAEMVRYNYCNCIGWNVHVAHRSHLEFFGEKVKYCPWCGARISYEEIPLTQDEIENVRELLKRACL